MSSAQSAYSGNTHTSHNYRHGGIAPIPFKIDGISGLNQAEEMGEGLISTKNREAEPRHSAVSKKQAN